MRCAMSDRGALPPLVVIVGATAVGKTALSLTLCERCAGEVVSADSRQIYRGMNIGTAKASLAERSQVPHHLIDIRDPDAVLTVAEYQALAYAAIDDIHRRGRVPFLVGGTALYVRAVAEGLRIPSVPPDPVLRVALEADLAESGVDALARRLTDLDPKTAAQIDLRNPRRVLRALEIVLLTGHSKVDLEGSSPPPYRILALALDRPRADLHRRIDARVDAMFAQGLVAETERLLAAGYDPALPAMTSLGYREVIACLAGALTQQAAAARIKTETHRFVRHQATWFRKLPNLHWFDLATQDEAAVVDFVAAWLAAPSAERALKPDA